MRSAYCLLILKKEVKMSLIKRNQNLPSFSRFWDDDFFDRNWGLSNFSDSGTMPAVNIKETKDNFEVEMAAPGMNKDDFKVELDGNMLTISAEKTEEHDENKEEEKFSRREFSYQSFQRSFSLPQDQVEADNIEAHYDSGVLKLRIPKKEEAKKKARKKIEIV
jgi:HSP20 family protein